MRLFSKFKDYNTILEEILETKYFSTMTKNTLLSMIYKIEVSYKDYKTVKRKVREKEEFLEEILNVIKVYCDNIQIAEPDSNQAKMLIKNNVLALTNERERSVLTYPTEVALLYAISDIAPKYFYMQSDFLFKKSFQNILVEGYNFNNIEILNNFNGWSWDIKQKKEVNILSNIVYQNILMIKGENFLTEWRNYASNKRNFLFELKNTLKTITGTNDYFSILCTILYRNSKDKEKIDIILKEKYKELKKMQDKEKYLSDLKLKKNKYENAINKIDKILENPNLMIKEFARRNAGVEDDKKIVNVKNLKYLLQKERETFEKNIDEIVYLEKNINFVKRKNELTEFVNITTNKDEITRLIIELQKQFLNYIDKKISKLTDRNEFIDVLYELRYYRNMLISENTYVKDCEELEKIVNRILKKLITKCCKIGYIRIFSMDIALNYEIISYAIDTKIIDLEEIKLYFEFEKEGTLIKVFDKEIFEKQGRKVLDDPKKQLEVKQKKMIKLFN